MGMKCVDGANSIGEVDEISGELYLNCWQPRKNSQTNLKVKLNFEEKKILSEKR
jgi:hypothetical protein